MAKKKCNTTNFLSINNEERTSCFVVDLASVNSEKDDKKKKNNEKIKIFFEKAIEFKFREFVYDNINKFKKQFLKLKNIKILKYKNNFKKIFVFLENNKEKIENKEIDLSLISENKKKIEQLFIFDFFKLLKTIFKLFCRICYFVGWIILFLVRFVHLFIIKILRNVNIFKYEKIKISNFFSVFVKKLKLLKSFLKINTFFLISKKKKEKKNYNDFEEKERENKLLKNLNRKYSPLRSVLYFGVFLFLIIVPFKAFEYYKSFNLEEFKGRVLGVSESALNNFLSASQSTSEMNFNQAEDNFSNAGENFLKAKEELDDINGVIFALASIVPNEKVRLASESKKILSMGETASNLGKNLSIAFESLFGGDKEDVARMIDDFVFYGEKAIDNTKKLEVQINEINLEVIPEEYKEKFYFLKEKIVYLEEGLVGFVNISEKIKLFLGNNQNKRYLMIFQNNAEMRATGGFIGSFALVDFSNGKIKNIEALGGGSYDTEGGLTRFVTAPEPLHLVNPLWHFWDANWWPDWPTSAEKLMWFYEKSGGSTVDGIISFTPTVLEDILEIIGPIDMSEKYGIIFNSSNFWMEIQKLSEQKLTPEQISIGEKHEPKIIIGDLMNNIINELPKRLDKNKLIGLLSSTEKNLSGKHILFYFTDINLQNELKKRGWENSIKETDGDYLSVINTNIAGGKSDRKIEEVINHNAEVLEDGSIITTLKIKRTHTGIKREPFSGVRNVDWMRIYVPEGSELLEAHGFIKPDDIYFEEPDSSWEQDPLVYRSEISATEDEKSGTKIYQENGKTVFANWSMVDPGQSIEIYLKYKLPFIFEKKEEEKNSIFDKIQGAFSTEQKENYPYSLFIQKQPGSKDDKINTGLKIHNSFRIKWKYPKNIETISDGWQFSDNLDCDKYWAVILEK